MLQSLIFPSLLISGQQGVHELAVCPWGQEGQATEDHQEEHCQQVKSNDSSHLLSPGEVTSGRLCPVLGSPAQDRHGDTQELSGCNPVPCSLGQPC